MGPAPFLLFALAGVSDDALERFVNAPSREVAEALVSEVLASSASFDEVHTRLARGRDYAAEVPRGRVLGSREIGGVEHPYMLQVPRSYDPARKWLVRFDLHGGMGQPRWTAVDGAWSAAWAAIEDYDNSYITVLPAGWWDSMWWEASQVENFRALLDELKRTYNVDENRVVFVGASDGGVAAWFYAMRWPDPWTSYASFIGFPARLTNTELRPDGQLHLSNLEGQRFFCVNGVRDNIIDVKVMRKYLEVVRASGAVVDYREHAKDGHSLRLTDEEELAFGRFLSRERRDPLPDELSWATERADRYNRRSWLLITELEPEHEVDETNVLPRIFGKNVPRQPPPERVPWGRVEVARTGNTVRASTVGVRTFKLLLSPAELDFDEPVHVVVDGKDVFAGKVERDLEVLLRWYARDCDRTMLFAAELDVIVP